MTIYLLSLLFLSSSCPAADEPEYQVEVNPRVYSPEAFKSKNVKVGTIPVRKKRPDAIPDRKVREEAFGAVPGLQADVVKMDELARDILYVRAKTKPLKDLQNLYPQIAAEKLAQLRKEAHKR